MLWFTDWKICPADNDDWLGDNEGILMRYLQESEKHNKLPG